MDLVIVIVPVYNVEDYLEKCLESILNQTYENLEIILVNDGSQDRSSEICRRYKKKDKRIMLIEQENQGLSAARNRGLEEMSGQYICFVDSDDYIEPNMIEVLYRACEQEHVMIAVCGRFNDFGNKLMKQFCLEEKDLMESEEAIRNLLNWIKLDSAVWDKMFAANLFDEIRFPIGMIHEDLVVTYQLLIKSKKIVHVGVPLYHYVQRQESITRKTFTKKSMDLYYNAQKLTQNVLKVYPNLYKECTLFMIHIRNSLMMNIVKSGVCKAEVKYFFKHIKIEQKAEWKQLRKLANVSVSNRKQIEMMLYMPMKCLIFGGRMRAKVRIGKKNDY